MGAAPPPPRPPKKTITAGAWQEARVLVYAHRGRLGLGLVLLLVNRLAGLVLPSSSKWVIDRVINGHRPDLLLPLALAAGGEIGRASCRERVERAGGGGGGNESGE